MAIVLEALFKVAKKALARPAHWVIAGLSFLGIFAFALPFPAIIAAAAIWGYLTTREPAGEAVALPAARGTGTTIAAWLALWLAPIAALWLAGAELLTQVATFFSKLAVVTFGGAYAVLAYMTQEVVQDRGWLTTAEMMDGLGLAETTPGPLILVTEFVGFLAGFREGGLALAIAAAALTLWVTFVPCFLWIFAGAPYLDWISARPRLTGALRAITAAVVGVILNLSLWFAAHVIFRDVPTVNAGPLRIIAPEPASLDFAALALAIGATFLLLVLKWPLLRVLGISALVGLGLGSLV
ncbi:MAG: chromate transporter [Pseudomonadota bacterium]